MRVRMWSATARSTTVQQLLWWGEYAGFESECPIYCVKPCKFGGLPATRASVA